MTTDDYRRSAFYLQNGVDVSLSISYPQKILVEAADWIEDNEAPNCMLCHKDFSIFVRRHHCRRCGRVFCDDCCPKSVFSEVIQGMDRACVCCSAVLLLAEKDIPPGEYDIRPYFGDQKLLGAINQPDVVMQGEVIRVFQNCMRNNDCRSTLMKEWRQLFDRVVPLIKICADLIINKDQQPFFKSSKGNLRPSDAQVVLSNCLGLIINFTASTHLEYASFLYENIFRENKILDVLMKALQQDIDLVRREQAIWALRNLTQVQAIAVELSNSQPFKTLLFQLLQTNVRNITESVVSICSNLSRAKVGFSSDLINGVPGVIKKQEFVTLLLPLLQEGTPTMRGQILRCLALMTADSSARSFIQTTSFFSSCLQFIIDVEKQPEQARISYENSVLGGALLAVKLIFEGANDETFCSKFARMVTSSSTTIKIILKYVSNPACFACVGAAGVLKALAQYGYDGLYKQISANRDVFITSFKTILTVGKFEVEDVSIKVKEVFSIIKLNDEDGITKGIKSTKDVGSSKKKTSSKKKKVEVEEEDDED